MFVFFPLGFQARKKPKAERFTEEEEEEDSFFDFIYKVGEFTLSFGCNFYMCALPIMTNVTIYNFKQYL